MDDIYRSVTTPEKWDSVTRRESGSKQWYNNVKLFWSVSASTSTSTSALARLYLLTGYRVSSSIDEVHLLAEERGATLEVIISRMKSFGADSGRIIAVSATVPNIEDVAVWIGPGPHISRANGKARPMAHVLKFSDAFRTCPLQKYVFLSLLSVQAEDRMAERKVY